MVKFYLLGSVLAVIIYLIGEYYDDEYTVEVVPNQKIILCLLAFCLSWFGIIGGILFNIEDEK